MAESRDSVIMSQCADINTGELMVNGQVSLTKYSGGKLLVTHVNKNCTVFDHLLYDEKTTGMRFESQIRRVIIDKGNGIYRHTHCNLLHSFFLHINIPKKTISLMGSEGYNPQVIIPELGVEACSFSARIIQDGNQKYWYSIMNGDMLGELSKPISFFELNPADIGILPE
jgi:hypothetical protein